MDKTRKARLCCAAPHGAALGAPYGGRYDARRKEQKLALIIPQTPADKNQNPPLSSIVS